MHQRDALGPFFLGVPRFFLSLFFTGHGLRHSELITQDLITAYIPFLLLERTHVKQYIRNDMIKRGYCKEGEISEAKVQEVLDEMKFYPDDLKLYCVTGCKSL